MSDVFLSYRRKDAETEAFLLYKDLTSAGISTFYDHKTLGGGDFVQNIHSEIKKAKNVIVFLSKSSFEERIFDESDVYREEIAYALKTNKRIIGIMIDGFDGFPKNLPSDIDDVRYMNCLQLYVGYYDEMFNKLISGSFLKLKKKNEEKVSNFAIQNEVPEELKQMATLPMETRMQSTQLLLELMKTFNESEILMRFYNYFDLYDRNKGISENLKYTGTIPLDLSTYLSFFETLYIIIGSKTLDLSVIDFAYRYRFFAGCNMPIMQESELLPLGYQYPNILSLYNIWTEYIVDRYDHSQKCESISNEIPLYENDLHKQYASYSFAKKIHQPIKIRFLNRYLTWLNLTLKCIDESSLKECLELQDIMMNQIFESGVENYFQRLSDVEMQRALSKDICVGLYEGNQLVAQINLILNPSDSENLVLDLDEKKDVTAAIIDYVVVHPKVRGYSIQKTLLFVAECICKNNNMQYMCAVTSPQNINSIKNFLQQKYKIIATLPKYGSTRHYLWKKI